MNWTPDEWVGIGGVMVALGWTLTASWHKWRTEGTRGQRLTYWLPENTADGQLVPGDWDDEPDPAFVARLRADLQAEAARLYPEEQP